MSSQHKALSEGRWFTLSLAEQMGNIGSEVNRAKRWQNRNPQHFEKAVTRTLDLFDLTLADPRWSGSARGRGRLKEIARARELFCDAAFEGEKTYNSSLADLERYFFSFACLARRTF